MVSHIRLPFVAASILVAGLAAGTLAAQRPPPLFPKQNFEVRSELEARARTAEVNGVAVDAYRLRHRLEQGDFQDGDRIFVTFQQGSAAFGDTLTVQAGRTLQLAQMGEMSLAGVLRSELVPRLTEHLAKYLREPVVRAIPLVRLGFLGNVARPGYYYTPADMPLNDVLMRAGGPTSNADLGRVSVKRLGDVVIDQKNTRTAFREGMSVDMLGMRSGDEIEVGEKRRTSWGMIIPIASSVIGLVFAVMRN